MEYDMSTSKKPQAPPKADTTVDQPGRGQSRVAGDESINDTSVLMQPITFLNSKRTAPNRFLKAPMTERLCHWSNEDITARGFPSPELINLYKRWGEGGIGIIVGGNMMIKYDAVEALGNPILCDNHDGRIEKYKELVKAAKAHGSLFISQLSHPGRQGGKALNPHPVSASDVQLNIKWAGNEFAKPTPLSKEGIQEVVHRFGETAYLCHLAGYDGVQVHCAHGYLLAQFLSPTTNRRTDEYGFDTLENRSRIVFEVIGEIKKRVVDPRFIVCVKINSVEFQDKGTTPEDCRALCVLLERAGVDFVDLSGGTFEGRAFEHKKESTKKREAYFIEFAEMIRPHLKECKIFVTGGFRTTGGMVRAVREGACDGVGIGRPLSMEPYLCKEIVEGRIRGAIENLVPLPQNTQASGSQLHQIGRGELVSDWSVTEEVDRWMKEFEVMSERNKALLPKVESCGYPVLRAEAGFEYLK